MRKFRWILPILLVLLLGCAVTAQAEGGGDPAAVLSVSVSAGGVPEELSLWMADKDQAVVFLPSFARPEDVVFRVDTGEPVSLGGQTLSSGMTGEGFLPDEDYPLTVGNREALRFRFVSSPGVAALFLHTDPGGLEAVHADKEHKEEASVALFTQDGRLEYRSGAPDSIRGRGQWSWKQAKKPYNLYLSKSTDLLGLGSSKHWALLADALDETHLRNRMVLRYAKQLGSYEGFSQDCGYVELYVNGEYKGLYLLAQRVKPSATRRGIENGSWLFSTDDEERFDKTEEKAFALNPGIAVEITEPSPCTQEQADWLKERLLAMQEAFLSESGKDAAGRAWTDYIDLDSWARKYLIEEIFLNYDAGAQSQYYFWNPTDDRIYAGPCWDYDNTLGVNGYGMTPNCFLARRVWKTAKQYTPWYGALWEKREFSDYVLKLYQEEFLPALQTFAEEIPRQAADIRQAAEADWLRWPERVKQYASYDERVENFRVFLDRRIRFLNSAWIDGTEYCTITLKTEKGQYRFFCVQPGTVCEELPTPEDMKVRGVKQWRYEDTGELFDYDTVIWEDTVLFAK